jgi:hypothetical protein
MEPTVVVSTGKLMLVKAVFRIVLKKIEQHNKSEGNESSTQNTHMPPEEEVVSTGKLMLVKAVLSINELQTKRIKQKTNKQQNWKENELNTHMLLQALEVSAGKPMLVKALLF